MTQQNNEFEKWATKHIVSKILLEFNTMKHENDMYKSHIMQRKFEAWLAAKADSEREIAIALEQLDRLFTRNDELQARINVLREALEIARDYQFDAVSRFHDDFAGYKDEKHKQYDADLANTEKALASTPAQHNNER